MIFVPVCAESRYEDSILLQTDRPKKMENFFKQLEIWPPIVCRKKPSDCDGDRFGCCLLLSYLVTLKALSSLTERRTERPMGGMTSHLVSTSSMMDVVTTKQSNLLNSDALYPCKMEGRKEKP